MPEQPIHYDVFVSYAREDKDWVEKELCARLRLCQTAQNQSPSVFLDVDTIQPGHDWMTSLANAIEHSSWAVVVYSKRYFEKEMCQWELGKIVQRHAIRKMGIVPIAIESELSVPFKVNEVQYWTIDRPDWFQRVAQGLRLIPNATRPANLVFMDQPENALVNHTLKTVRLALLDEDGNRVNLADKVSLSSQEAHVQGTLSTPIQDGIAAFTDLSVGNAVESMRLEASAQGIDPIVSRPFAILESAKPSGGPSESPLSAVPGEASVRFFESGDAMIATSPDILACFALDGELRGDLKLTHGIRRLSFNAHLAAAALWNGQIAILDNTGLGTILDPQQSNARRLNLVGDLCLSNGYLYAGYWNGQVFQLSLDGACQQILHHEGGIQALSVAGDLLCVSDLEGTLCVYRDQEAVLRHKVDQKVLAMTAYETAVVIIGSRNLYQLSLTDALVQPWQMSLDEAVYTFSESALPVIMDGNGQGIRVDQTLAIHTRFHTTQGSRPTTADHQGTYCVFKHSDGSHSLMAEGRVRYSQRSHSLSVSHDGKHFAIGSENGVQVLDETGMRHRMREDRIG